MNAALRADEFIDHSTAVVNDAPVSILNERYPCEGCARARDCAAGLLACAAFARYVDRRRWRSADRLPTAERWRAIFVSGKAQRAVRVSRAVVTPGDPLGAPARRLGISRTTLRKWIHLGAPVVRVRPSLRGARIDVDAVAKWQARHLPQYRRRSSDPSTEPRRLRHRLATQRWRARQRAQVVSGKRDQLPGDTP